MSKVLLIIYLNNIVNFFAKFNHTFYKIAYNTRKCQNILRKHVNNELMMSTNVDRLKK